MGKEIVCAEKMSTYIVDKVVLRMMYFILLIDSINGFFIHMGFDLPLSQMYKIILMILMSFRLLTNTVGRVIVWGSLFYMTILFVVYSFRSSVEIFLTYTHLFRFLILVWTYVYFRQLIIENPQNTYKQIIKIIQINIIIVIFNILLGLIGLGTNSYGNIGSKGYFYAGNELSGIIMVIYPIYLFYVKNKRIYNSSFYYLWIFLFLLTALLLGTKTGLIAVFLSIIFVSLTSIDGVKVSLLKSIFVSIIGSIFILLIGYISLNKTGFLKRWIFFYNRGGLTSVILSGRDEYWNEEKEILFRSGMEGVLFGLGGAKTVEMDPFDTFLNYGIIGIIIVYFFYLYLLLISYRYRKKNNIAKLILFINLMFFTASCLSGHIVFSAMAGPFIALLNILVFIPNKIIKGEELLLGK